MTTIKHSADDTDYISAPPVALG